MNLHNVIISPLITEKTEAIKNPSKDTNRYSLKVRKNASKELIRQALHKIFKVDAVKINTMIVMGKHKRFRTSKIKLPTWKKAVVTLAAGQSLDLTRKA